MIKTITERWLRENCACCDGIRDFKKQRNHDLIVTLRRLERKGRGDYIYWLFDKTLPKDLKYQWQDDIRSYLIFPSSNAFLEVVRKYISIIEKRYRR